MNDKNYPIKKLNIGALKGAVFFETRTGKDGKEFDSYSVKLAKSYQDRDGEWREQSVSIFDDKLLEFSFLCEQLYAYVVGHKMQQQAKKNKDNQPETSDKTNSQYIDEVVGDDIPY